MSILANSIVLEITHSTIDIPKYFVGYVASRELKATLNITTHILIVLYVLTFIYKETVLNIFL